VFIRKQQHKEKQSRDSCRVDAALYTLTVGIINKIGELRDQGKVPCSLKRQHRNGDMTGCLIIHKGGCVC
jgi:hypothetical protein